MSKKTHRMAEQKEARRAARKAVLSGGARSYSRPARGTRQEGPVSTRTVRAVGLVVALAVLAAGVYWSWTVGDARQTPGMIAGLIALGFLGGLGAYAAARPARVQQILRARRR